MLVVDAGVVLSACQGPGGFALFGGEPLLGPPILWSECRSVLHETLWRAEISREQAEQTLQQLETAPIVPRSPPQLGRRAWALADAFGWAKTCDAEYVALADLSGCRLVTLDGRLRRATDRLGFVIMPDEL